MCVSGWGGEHKQFGITEGEKEGAGVGVRSEVGRGWVKKSSLYAIGDGGF